MGTRLQRHLGAVSTIEAGQWTSDPLRHRVGQMLTVYFACPKCGGVDEIATNRIAADGGVVPAVECSGSCSFKDFVTLEGWREPVFDVSDVKRGSA